MTTGAHEVMTVDELQHHLVEDCPGGGTLTLKGPYEYCVNWSFTYTMECAELPLHAILQLACGKKAAYVY